MKAIGVNGSPRKKWNTATLLERALEGAGSQGAKTELVHLYDLDYKGCISCFACKKKTGRSYGKCAVRDGLTPLLRKVTQADVIILGSPIYFGTVTGEMRSFLERLFFPCSPIPNLAAPSSPERPRRHSSIHWGPQENWRRSGASTNTSLPLRGSCR